MIPCPTVFKLIILDLGVVLKVLRLRIRWTRVNFGYSNDTNPDEGAQEEKGARTVHTL